MIWAALILAGMSQQIAVEPSLEQQLRVFADSAKIGQLRGLAGDSRLSTFFDSRVSAANRPLTQQTFVDTVRDCPIARVTARDGKGFVELSCPDDEAHGGGVVSYYVAIRDGLVSSVSLVVGRIPVVATSGN